MFKKLIPGTLLLVAALGCGGPYREPTVKEFNGRLLRDGQPVAFPDAKEVTLTLFFHKNGEQFGIPIQPDGTFKIGWMPIGNYTGSLEVKNQPPAGKPMPPPNRHQLPGEFEIKKDQTEYEIDLGKGFKA